ncbi:hypothetical protein SSS_07093 [Sarcoptes scabiei]|nr:hypothetical protein SSS_07093 [Sarcoptes scabiei]
MKQIVLLYFLTTIVCDSFAYIKVYKKDCGARHLDRSDSYDLASSTIISVFFLLRFSSNHQQQNVLQIMNFSRYAMEIAMVPVSIRIESDVNDVDRVVDVRKDMFVNDMPMVMDLVSNLSIANIIKEAVMKKTKNILFSLAVIQLVWSHMELEDVLQRFVLVALAEGVTFVEKEMEQVDVYIEDNVDSVLNTRNIRCVRILVNRHAMSHILFAR